MPSKATIFVILVAIGAVLLVVSASGLAEQTEADGPLSGSGFALR